MQPFRPVGRLFRWSPTPRTGSLTVLGSGCGDLDTATRAHYQRKKSRDGLSRLVKAGYVKDQAGRGSGRFGQLSLAFPNLFLAPARVAPTNRPSSWLKKSPASFGDLPGPLRCDRKPLRTNVFVCARICARSRCVVALSIWYSIGGGA